MQKWATEMMETDKPLHEGLEELNPQSLEKQRKEEPAVVLPPLASLSLSEKGEKIHAKHRTTDQK